jgi:hypothetical protein
MAALRSMAASASRASFSGRPRRSSRVQPRTAVIGVRSSWESVARNASLRRLASSSAVCAAISAVMSRNSSTAPAGRPSRCSGESEQATGKIVPSLRTKRSWCSFSGTSRSRALRIGQSADAWPPRSGAACRRSWNGARENSASVYPVSSSAAGFMYVATP